MQNTRNQSSPNLVKVIYIMHNFHSEKIYSNLIRVSSPHNSDLAHPVYLPIMFFFQIWVIAIPLAYSQDAPSF